MKYFIAVVALAALAAAAPQQQQQQQQPKVYAILRQASNVQPNEYQYSYETENGIAASEQGQLKSTRSAETNEEGQAIVAQGEYSYTDDQGQNFKVTYVADENGFQPQGAHLPVAPAVPEYILRALEYIRTHPQPEESKKNHF